MPADPSDETTDPAWRWKYLSTMFAVIYGLGFPAWVLVVPVVVVAPTVDGAMMGVLTLVWLATAAYILGPDMLVAAQKARAG